ncbi:MAG: homoprotocatechuate degradation operon regulator HpaR [Rhodobacteraceae bacterium]|nr:homoprotocatechuate degradation operon regulator HpaR [Paracoccaceae bacterium]PHR53621.1 MAG: homoprotocatechuate degradation operon regulator HpaR [Robiginitomaculum sp.]
MDEVNGRRLRSFQRALPISLLRAREGTMRRFKGHVESYGLTLQQWRVIRALADDSPLDSKTLSERCVILPPSLTRIFRTLSEKDLIHSVKTEDNRRHLVVLSKKGLDLFEEASVGSEAIYRDIEARFGMDNMTELLRLLDELRNAAMLSPEDSE